MFSSIALFAGSDGLAFGIEKAEFNTLACFEFDKNPAKLISDKTIYCTMWEESISNEISVSVTSPIARASVIFAGGFFNIRQITMCHQMVKKADRMCFIRIPVELHCQTILLLISFMLACASILCRRQVKNILQQVVI